MRALIFDPFAGISGDMTLAALIDLGLPDGWLQDFVAGLGIGDITVTTETVRRRGIAAPHVRFSYPPEKAHRHLRHVVEIIERANTSARAKELAIEAFRHVAVAEARVHGTTLEKVHFHEVGATDAILDILGVMAAVTELGFDAFFTRPIAIGHGWVDIEHGRYPVPAPATLGILAGLPLTGQELPGECTTPTGAAILAALTGGRVAPAQFTPHRIGFGAGTRDPEDRPNVLRLIEADVAAPAAGDDAGAADVALWLVQADMDDMTGEYAAAAQQALLDGGALDAVMLQVSMKKGRPGIRLEMLAPAARLDELERLLFSATTTIGVRRWPLQRTVLDRQELAGEWNGRGMRWKQVVLPDGTSRMKPEYEDVMAAAGALGLSPLDVRHRLGEAGPAGGTPANGAADQ